MDNQIIIKLYDFVVNNQQISYGDLLSVGFSELEIEDFFDKRILIFDKTNIKFNDLENLYKYGEKLLTDGKSLKAYKCFKTCSVFPKDFKDKCFQLLVYSLKKRNMFLASKNFEMFCEIEPKISEQDKNLYLYLISFVGDFSEEHRKQVSNMTFNNFELIGFKEEVLREENQIRELISEDHLILAINKLKNSNHLLHKEYLLKLLATAIQAECDLEEQIHNCVKEHKYAEIERLLLEVRSKRYLKSRQIYILMISQAILKLQNNEEIVETKCENPEDFYLALRSNNFALALQLQTAKLVDKNIDRETDSIYLLLLDINAMIIEKSEPDIYVEKNEEKLNLAPLFELIINKQTINDEKLIEVGYSGRDIKNLLQTKKLCLNGDCYTLIDVKNLYKYGESLILNCDYNKANACFKICIELDPNHRNSYLQRIFSALKYDDLELVVQYFSNMLNNSNDSFIKEDNLYILLLNYFCDLPFEGKKPIYLRDIVLEKDCEESYINNEVREHIYNNRLTYAMYLINEYKARNPKYDIKLLFLKELLSKAIFAFDKIKSELFKLAQQERYFDIYETLSDIKSIRRLSSAEMNIYLASRALVQILITNQIPQTYAVHPKSIHEALKANNFLSAIILDKEFLLKNKIDKKEDTLFLILSKICKTINKLKEVTQDIIPSTSNEEETYMEDINQKLKDILFFMKEDGLSIEETIIKYNLTKEEILFFKLLIAQDAISLGYETLGMSYLEDLKNNSESNSVILSVIKEIEKNMNIARKRVEN